MRRRLEILLIIAPKGLRGGTASGHGPHAAAESSETNHQNVNQKKEHQENSDEEVNGSGGLLAA
jgi:hypothetical protein